MRRPNLNNGEAVSAQVSVKELGNVRQRRRRGGGLGNTEPKPVIPSAAVPVHTNKGKGRVVGKSSQSLSIFLFAP